MIVKYFLLVVMSVCAALEGYGEDVFIDGCRFMFALAFVYDVNDFVSLLFGLELNECIVLDLFGEFMLECLN